MFDVKVLWFLIALILVGYSVMLVLSQIKPFREYMEKGAFSPFEGLLIMCAFFVLCAGAWVNGYREGLKNGKN